MNDLAKVAAFYFEGNYLQAIRIIDKEDSHRFVAMDICDLLDIKKSGHTFDDFPPNESEWYTIPLRSKNGVTQNRKVRIVTEAGLYRLVFKSRKPEAEQFKTWVFNEVLPSIRKYGFYRASLPKNWTFQGDESLTWGEWIKKREVDYMKKHPNASYEDFLQSLPNR